MTERMQLVSLKLTAGDQVPDISLTATDGHTVALSSLYHGTPLILSFLRHFG